MALTLLESNKLNDGNIKLQAVIQMFAENADILRVLPFEDIPGGSITYTLEGELSGVGFRGFNEAYKESTGILNQEVEVLRIAGGDLDVDKALIKTRGESIRDTQEAMKVKALALTIASVIVNGDSEVDPREFDGLRKRITGEQLVNAGTTAGGNALSLFDLDAAIDKVDGATHLMMNKTLRNRLNQAAKANLGGDMLWDKDEFGERIASYNNLPILIADYDAKGDPIMGFDEIGAGGGAEVCSSIYILAIGDAKLTGLQNGAMEVKDLGEIDDKPVFRTRVEWLMGMAAMHGRCAARVRGIKNAAFVA